MSVIFGISVSELTVQAAWVAVLAILALTLVGWTKPARAAPLSPRGASDSAHDFDQNDELVPGQNEAVNHAATSEEESVAVISNRVPLERPTTLPQRLLAAVAAAGLSVLTGIVLAVVLSFTLVITVVWATNLLGR